MLSNTLWYGTLFVVSLPLGSMVVAMGTGKLTMWYARRKVDQAVQEVDALILELEELRSNLYSETAEFQRQE